MRAILCIATSRRRRRLLLRNNFKNVATSSKVTRANGVDTRRVYGIPAFLALSTFLVPSIRALQKQFDVEKNRKSRIFVTRQRDIWRACVQGCSSSYMAKI